MIDSTCKNHPSAAKAKHYINVLLFWANFWSLGDFYFYFPKLWRMVLLWAFGSPIF
jgi:hypothetical protein